MKEVDMTTATTNSADQQAANDLNNAIRRTLRDHALKLLDHTSDPRASIETMLAQAEQTVKLVRAEWDAGKPYSLQHAPK